MLPKINIQKKPNYIKCQYDLDPFLIFKRINKKYDKCFILESLGYSGKLSRHTVLGFSPQHTIKANENKLIFDDTIYEVKNPFFALREIVPSNIISRQYAGGLVGYVSYEAMNYFESSLQLKTHSLFDQFNFCVYTDGLIFDKMTGELWYFHYNTNRYSLIEEIINEKIEKTETSAILIGDTLDEKFHENYINIAKDEISKGNTFQVEIGFKREFKIEGNNLDIYEKLREINPSPHMFYIKNDKNIVLGASPELFLRIADKAIETYPLAGTCPRGKTEKEDMELARKLLNDPKEIAEHKMLIDLHRNDLGKVATFGSVKIRSLMDIKKFSHVQHISSELSGILKDGEDMYSAFASNFPMGTGSGAPKIESMKIINRLEKTPRGPYCGAIGTFGFNGDCTFALPVRSLYISDSYAYTQACGGVVFDSTAKNEYLEVQNKMRAITKAIEFFYK